MVSNMTDAVKPCPFCGHRAKVIELEHAYWNAKIKCTFCHVQTDLYNLEQHKEAMIADWNRRTPPARWKLVPIEPPEQMWGGLARDMMMWLDMDQGNGCPTPRNLIDYLENKGTPIPKWLLDEAEMQTLDHVPSKGSRVVWIYKAMLSGAPENET